MKTVAALVLLLVGMYLSYVKGDYFVLVMGIGVIIYVVVKAVSTGNDSSPTDTKQVDSQDTHQQSLVSDSHLSSPNYSMQYPSAKGKEERDIDFDYRDAATGMMLFGPVGAGLGIKDRDKSKDSEGEK